MNEIDVQLNWQYICQIIQARIKVAESYDGFVRIPMDSLRKAMFGRFAYLFGSEFNLPDNRLERLNVMSAIFGRALSSGNDLYYHEVYTFLEVTNELAGHISTELSDRFKTIIAERFAGTAWLFASDETVLRMWDLPSGDERVRDTTSTHARSDNNEGHGAETLTGAPKISEPPF